MSALLGELDFSELREFAAIALGLVALIAILGNYSIAIRRDGSLIPIVGGLAGALAMVTWPETGLWKWAWIPLVIDLGGLPIVAFYLVWKFRKPKLDAEAKQALLDIAVQVERGERPASDLERYGFRVGPARTGEAAKQELIRALGLDDEDPSAPDHVHAHRFSRANQELVAKSRTVGCFHCLNLTTPLEITAWRKSDQTALCPKCGEDTLIPSEVGYPMTPEFLQRMYRYWIQNIRE